METWQQKQIRMKNFYHNFTYSFKVHGEEEALKTLFFLLICFCTSTKLSGFGMAIFHLLL